MLSVAAREGRLEINRYFTSQGVHPYSTVEWSKRDVSVGAFVQSGVEFPVAFSQNAAQIVASKYFYGDSEDPNRESSLKDTVNRVADTITEWGQQDGYFPGEYDPSSNGHKWSVEALIFNHELKHILINQMAAFNSPVWFNVGIPGRDPQCSACFILSVEDTMESILQWYFDEGVIFKRGSGAGVNLSAVRSSQERLSSGSPASGPVSFMRGADASAGVIKSGSTTRKAAKMVILDVDHPDVVEFIWTKAREEKKIRALSEAGFDMSFDGEDNFSVQYQNANNSVRVSDEFMQAVANDEDWEFKSRTTGEVVGSMSARQLWSEIAQAAWECADPGVQYDDNINNWHTTPNAGRINGSNPCSEYMHLDNSACNLASINLKKFDRDGEFDVDGFKHTVEILITAQDILVGNSSYPTERVGENARAYRQLGLGFSNLGGFLMSRGLAYDSDEGRAYAGAITALLTGHAYNTSAALARAQGPFDGFEQDRDGMIRVLKQHRDKLEDVKCGGIIDALRIAQEASVSWDQAIADTEVTGIRNAQASVIAPVGTIGLMMDCDTLGIEPDLGLVKYKQLVGGGSMKIANRSVEPALRNLGYSDASTQSIIEYIEENDTILGAPGLDPVHLSVFATAMGDVVIDPLGHVKMMAAVQPFISGAISKTVNMPEESTVDDIAEIYRVGWELGIKAIAVYRDNCKFAQPMSGKKKAAIAEPEAAVTRKKLPQERSSRTVSFYVGEAKGYITVGEYEDGSPGEMFIKLGKQGSTLSGFLDSLAISVSLGLQYGVPLEAYVNKLSGTMFEPAGMTNDRDIRMASSIVDYVAKYLAKTYMNKETRNGVGVYTTGDRLQLLEQEHGGEDIPEVLEVKGTQRRASDAPLCHTCGTQMRRNGACHICESCGTTSGCS